uniref:SPOR domain-containing protein n=1 Tax=Pseudescherichia sp. TaxID=2055881 RepID=UPI0028ABF531
PAAAAPAAAAPTATANASTGNVGSLKSAPGSHYTLQLSSSSNYNNLNAWAKKENLKNFVVYQTSRNGQPWYVLVSGVYASKDDAKRAVSTLPADVQAKNPWAKPLHQVQADLK